MKSKSLSVFAVLALSVCASATSRAAVIPVVEDVMTSSFFQGTDLVRGYPGDNRPTMRVSTNNPFGQGAPETIYLTFSPASFAGFSGPVPSAVLSVESVAGGFAADASAVNPFQISAHAVNANPLTSIIDDTNPGGTIAWSSFFTNNILPASLAATTTVTGFGVLQFDVTSIVNDWISGANTVFAIALTGKNDTLSDGDVLHGIRNNNDAGALGVTFITTVPEPATAGLALVGLGAAAMLRRRTAVA